MLSRKHFDDDPFFAGHQDHMRQMEKFFREPFGFGQLDCGGRSEGRGRGDQHNRWERHGDELAPRSLFDFGGFGHMFQRMQQVMDDMQHRFATSANSPDGHMYSHSSFSSYFNVGGGQPKMFQATSSAMQAPGRVRETRKTLRDSETGMEKMAVGHHIGDKGHVIQRERNRHTGKEEQNQEYLNLEESQAEEFDREWQERTQHYRGRKMDDQPVEDRTRRHRARGLPAAGSSRRGHQKALGFSDWD